LRQKHRERVACQAFGFALYFSHDIQSINFDAGLQLQGNFKAGKGHSDREVIGTVIPIRNLIDVTLGKRCRLEFNAVYAKKPGLQHVKLTTKIPGLELDSADRVWVAAR
jgi:hypothetical protein